MKQDSKIECNKPSNGDRPSLPALARQHAPAAVAELTRIIVNTRSDAACLTAIGILLDRGLGKPPKPFEIAIKDRVKPDPPPCEEEMVQWAAACDRFQRTGHFSIDDLNDADLEACRASIPVRRTTKEKN